MKFVSLFSGIGGFDLGFERAGMECVAQVEFDERAASVLARHWPDVPRFKDVRDVGKHNLPDADVLCGGFPCQDVSVAGNRAGLAGERSGLWFEFRRIAAETAPQFVVIENVPGLLSSNGGQDFAAVLHGLVKCGYRCAWRILDAQYFGVAQRRRRVFIVGSLGDGRAAEILFERESGGRDTEPRRAPGAELARDVAACLRSAGSKTGTHLDAEHALAVVGTISASGAGTARTGNARNEVDMLITEAAHAKRMRGFGDYEADDTASALKARDGKDATDLIVGIHAGNGMDISPTLTVQSQCHVHETGTGKSAFAIDLQQVTSPANRTQPSEVSGTLSRSSDVVTFNSRKYGVRRLTPVECERLQGFPDGWTSGKSDTERYRQLGNAVAVPVAEWIGRNLTGVTR